MSDPRRINAVVIHCSDTPQGRELNVYDVDAMHKARGFARRPADVASFNSGLKHIGYHYLIDLQGRAFTGRAESETGAHVQGSNARSIGICMVGRGKYTRAQWDALAHLVADLQAMYIGATVLGHRDYSPDADGDGVVEPQEWLKTCPLFDVRTWLNNGMQPLAAHVVPA